MNSTSKSPHPAIAPGNLAVVTGAADGIGLAVARKLLGLGMRLCLIDMDGEKLAAAAADLGAGDYVETHVADVSDRTQLDKIAANAGPASVLMNNAAIGAGGNVLADFAVWERLININLMGVFYGVNLFLPGMIASGHPGLVINTGSKQGITQPPGNTAYNVAKSGVKSLTEGMAHLLREQTGNRITAHLLVPGFTYTGLMRKHIAEKPAAAWTPEQVADFMLEGIARGDFYILCPDNETSFETDSKRMAWAMGDLIENRPALSRWHPDFKEAFDQFMDGG